MLGLFCVEEGLLEMNRRELFGSIGLLAGAFAMPWPTKAVSAPALLRRRVLLQETALAGFQYHAGDECWDQMRVGDALRLSREPSNSHDAKAIAVYWEDQKLGYLPRAANTAPATLLDGDEDLLARITSLAEDADPWKRVRVGVVLCV